TSLARAPSVAETGDREKMARDSSDNFMRRFAFSTGPVTGKHSYLQCRSQKVNSRPFHVLSALLCRPEFDEIRRWAPSVRARRGRSLVLYGTERRGLEPAGEIAQCSPGSSWIFFSMGRPTNEPRAARNGSRSRHW